MKRVLMFFLAVFLTGGFLSAAQASSITYGWEDGGTILGSYSAITATNVESPDPVYDGQKSLKLIDGGASGTPQAYIGWVTGLENGDTVTAGFWVYDVTSGSPSGRIWGHYTDGLDINNYAGTASGSNTYSGNGWSHLDYTWTFDGTHDGLVIEARTYSDMGDTIWIDDLSITAPDHAAIVTPAAVPVPGAIWLLGSGLVTLLGIRRKKA